MLKNSQSFAGSSMNVSRALSPNAAVESNMGGSVVGHHRSLSKPHAQEYRPQQQMKVKMRNAGKKSSFTIAHDYNIDIKIQRVGLPKI